MSPSLLGVDGLSVSFGGVQALQGVTFQIEPGKIIGVMGPNGAGKTTLFNLITGVYRPTAGSIRFGDRELQGRSTFQICRAGIARTFQSGRPFTNMTARENVVSGLLYGCEHLGRAEADREAARLLDFVGLSRQADRAVASLNLMERKIVELARALATRPRLLMLDELLAGLNPSDLAPAIDVIRRIRDELGVTVFWIEHIMQVLMNTCEHLIVLHHGEKLAEGAPKEVVSDRQVAEAYFGSRGRDKLV
jgi:ABC-type branched-subunit amino acid transport system ATPase component